MGNKTPPTLQFTDEHGWETSIRYRNSMKDLVIKQKQDHGVVVKEVEIYINKKKLQETIDFLKRFDQEE